MSDEWPGQPIDNTPVDAWPGQQVGTEAADHGLSERQKLSPLGKVASPITSYPETYKHMNREAREQMSRGAGQLAHPDSALDPVYGAGNVAFGGLNFIASPINAAYRSIIGQPVEDATGIPREYTEFASQLATPGIGFTKMPKAPGVAAEAAPRITTVPGKSLEAKDLGDEFNIKYSRGQSEGDIDRIRYEDMAARGAYGPEAQARAAEFFNQQHEDIQRAGRGVGEQFGHGEQPLGTPADAGASLNSEIAGRAAQARQEQASLGATTERDAAEVRAAAAQRAESITDGITGQHPAIESPRDAGDVTNQAVREAAGQDRAHYQANYENVAREPGQFQPGTFQGVGSRIRNELHFNEESPVEINDLTPAANHAIRALDEWSTPTIRNAADPRGGYADPVTSVSLNNVHTFMKRLSQIYGQAKDATDKRAVGRIMGEFGDQVERAVSDGLFSGDPGALQMLSDAKASFRRYQQTYKPREAGDDVGTAMRRIVERNATPEETANMIIGSGKLGNAGLPVRIADRLQQVLGNDSEAWSSIRQAMWQRASQVRSAAGDIDHIKSARNIDDFAGSTLGRRMFSPEELTAMRNHARGSREMDSVIENLPSAAAERGARASYEQAFGGEGLTGSQRGVFQRMVQGTATPEETANAMFSIIGGGNPGNAVRALDSIEHVVDRESPVMGSVRQGIWQKLTQHSFGKDQPGQQKLVQSINEFLNGKGRMIAKRLYSEDERALMSRYADAVGRTIIPKYARTNSDTAPALLHAVRKYASAITSSLGVAFHGGITGGLEGYGVGKLIDKASEKIGAARQSKKLSASLDNIMPTDRARRLPNPLAAAKAIPFAHLKPPAASNNP